MAKAKTEEHKAKIRASVLRRQAEKRAIAAMEEQLKPPASKSERQEAPEAPVEAPESTPLVSEDLQASPAVQAVMEAEHYRETGSGDIVAIGRAIAAAITAAQNQNNQGLVDALEESQRRLQAKENPVPPLISAFNPHGERDYPRPRLTCDVLQCGFPVEPSLCTREELELINKFVALVEDCHVKRETLPIFRVTKADGVQMTVKLDTAWNDVSGRLERVNINYPVKTIDMRSGLYSFQHMLQEMLGLAPPNVDIAMLLQRVRTLEAENTALKKMTA